MGEDYNQLLKDPRWHAKRKRIFTRDGFKCTVCGATANLQAHHTYYYSQRTDPWDYPDESLITICEKCHHDWHEYHELEYRDRPDRKKKKVRRPKPKIKSKKKAKKGKRSLYGHTIKDNSPTPTRYRKKTEDGYKFIIKPP
jgi:5-methylcytosine-specific restriction endonuclease McrA